MRPRYAKVIAVLGAVVLCANNDAANAQSWPPSDGALIDLANDSMLSVLRGKMRKDKQTAPSRQRERAATQPVSTGSTLAPAMPSGTVPARMAARYPVAMRAKATRDFAGMLNQFATLEGRLQIPHNDVAGALAGFVAGNVMASQDKDVPDAHFKALVVQMRGRLASDPAFANMQPSQKRVLYEELAIAGMFLSVTRIALKSQPDPVTHARMVSTARMQLSDILGLDPDAISIGPDGLVGR